MIYIFFERDVLVLVLGSSPQLPGDTVLFEVARDARLPPATALPGGVWGFALLGTASHPGSWLPLVPEPSVSAPVWRWLARG